MLLDISEEAVSALKNYDKPYIISLSGLKLSDNILMLEKVLNVDGISGIELNLACPNIPGKPIIGYDFDQMDVVLSTVVNTPEFGRYPLGVKLPPYFDISHFRKSAEIISKYRVSYVVAINTVGNALFVDMETESEAFAANSGLGGLGGATLSHTYVQTIMVLQLMCYTNRWVCKAHCPGQRSHVVQVFHGIESTRHRCGWRGRGSQRARRVRTYFMRTSSSNQLHTYIHTYMPS